MPSRPALRTRAYSVTITESFGKVRLPRSSWDRSTGLEHCSAECEYRVYLGIPRDTICIFNREQVLHGLYDVVARTVQRSSDPEFYDPKGYRTDLNVWVRDGNDDSKAVVDTWNKHLDDLWSLAAVPHWR
ncbi:hypothetical protein ACFY3G_04615 [Streptomyces phaeochromogenes]|uniref:hypothetical protein n=1 Tax=Streptomyces phaeochromogenes TaxID=1923 RepID=UPI00367A9D89